MDATRKKWYAYQKLGKGYFHLCSDGWKEGCLFYTDAQYASGMCTMALVTRLFPVVVYAFELMSNHIHVVLSGTGRDCCHAFFYIRKRISSRLKRDGYPPLPHNYDFKLIPIENVRQMMSNLLYLARNPYERALAVPGTYPWGSSYLYYSMIYKNLAAKRVGDIPLRAVNRLTGSRLNLPEDWLVNPDLGILPVSFVDTSLFYKLFKTPKEYNTRLVKDYESFAGIASSLGEAGQADPTEVKDMTRMLLQNYFGGRDFRQLERQEKYRLAAMLNRRFGIDSGMVAQATGLPENIVRQVLASKDFGTRTRQPEMH